MSATGILKQVGNDFLEVGTLVNVAFVLAVPYEEVDDDGNVVGPEDLTGFDIVLELMTGPPDAPGAVVLTWNQTPAAHGVITLDAPNGLATLSFAAMSAVTLPPADYSFRWKKMLAGVCVDRSFYGRWRHRTA